MTDFGRSNPKDPEYESVDDFAEYVIDDERTTFDIYDLRCLNFNHKLRIQVIRAQLEAYGLAYVPIPKACRVRGFKSNSHDRWSGPGSSKSHGGSGKDQIRGFAGGKG